MNKHHFYPEHLKPLKYFALAMFVMLPFLSFLIGVAYEDMKFFDTADPRTRIFQTQEECESFTDRKCLPTICEKNPQHESCVANNQTGWFATRQPLATAPIDSSTVPVGSTQGENCSMIGGTYLPNYGECEGVDQTQCTEIGGTFDECGSACRHNPDPNAACILMCVSVCKL